MKLTTCLRRLGYNDIRLIGRDLFQIYLFVYVIIIAAVARFALPYLDAYLAGNTGVIFSLADYYPLIIAYILIFLGACLVGMVFGFVLLQEKDDRMLNAILVSPLPLKQFVAYRVGVPLVGAFFMIILAVSITNIAVPPFWQLVLIAAGASPTASLVALYFALFAENKVQGLALTKFASAFGFLIVIAWFVPEPFQLMFGLFPPYWVSKAYWLALAGSPWWGWSLVLGIVLQVLLLLFLTRRFTKEIYHHT